MFPLAIRIRPPAHWQHDMECRKLHTYVCLLHGQSHFFTAGKFGRTGSLRVSEEPQ